MIPTFHTVNEWDIQLCSDTILPKISVPIPNKAVQPSSEAHPEQKKAEPKIDRQFSREVQRTEQPSEEAYNDLIG